MRVQEPKPGGATPGSTLDEDAPRRLFLLDGHSLAYRAFFALPPSLATSTGQVTNAVYGFTSMLIKLLAEEQPDLIAVAFDMGRPTIRLEKDEGYKAGRAETPGDFKPQIGLIEEVLEALRIPVLRVEDGHEADDAIGTLAVQAVAEGIDTTIVTADRDFFQLVRPGVTVMFNRKGISDIVRYDEAAVQERFGVLPAQYLDFVALKGDTSDNIPGVPGVGDKTAAKLVQRFGTVEALLDHVDELTGKQRENVEASAERLPLNKELAEIVTDVPLDIRPEECRMGSWETDEVQRLFTTLEFRTLLDRLQEAVGSDAPVTPASTIDLDLRTVDRAEIKEILTADGPVALRVHASDGRSQGVAVSRAEGQAWYAHVGDPRELEEILAMMGAERWTHDAKSLELALITARPEDPAARGPSVTFDTLLAAYLLDPAATDLSLGRLSERYLGTDLLASIQGSEEEGQLFASDPWRMIAGEAAVTALLAPILRGEVQTQSLDRLLTEVELPLASVLAGMQASGIRLDTDFLAAMNDEVTLRMTALREEIFGYAGREFNLGSPPQLRTVLYDGLGLQPGKKTPKGEPSTDASVLEKLRDAHPIVDALLSWRELDKLRSTYLEALPRLVDATDGRLHTTFNQASTTTGRLSSSNPNLQNIPVRSELGRQIRKAFVPGEQDQVLLVADYSQIELRILAHLSNDEGLRAAFESDADIHAETAARVFEVPIDQVDPELRRRAKAVNYGLAYGMNAWGLAQRLDIAPDEASEIMDAYFESFPSIAEYLDRQVAQATVDGYTETLLGRRRHIPELRAANPRVRDLGRRQALNAPIQGSASDVFKVAMIEVDRALRDAPELGCSMLLTVHDELVFEVDAGRAKEAAAVVRDRMEHAIDLDVPLRADIGIGADWSEASPEGH
jgi:DNA polymerase-1